MTSAGKKFFDALAIITIFVGIFGFLTFMTISENQTNKERKMCNMQLTTLKTLPDTIKFVKTDSGSSCLTYISRSY